MSNSKLIELSYYDPSAQVRLSAYLNTFGVTVADRIRNQFMPLFDPAKEPLSDEVLAINDCIMSRVGYSLYDAQLAVAEAVKRQLARKRVALIIAECGSGKTKIGSTALGALHGLWADQKRKDGRKSFGIVMCPSHVTQKWVREIGETLPDKWMAKKLRLSEELAHIGGFEMDRCQKLIRLCEKERNKEKKKETA